MRGDHVWHRRSARCADGINHELVIVSVPGVLKLEQMSRETAVLLLKYALETAVRHGIVLGEQDADCEPNPMIEQAI